jgi:chromosome segregation ATPase
LQASLLARAETEEALQAVQTDRAETEEALQASLVARAETEEALRVVQTDRAETEEALQASLLARAETEEALQASLLARAETEEALQASLLARTDAEEARDKAEAKLSETQDHAAQLETRCIAAESERDTETQGRQRAENTLQELREGLAAKKLELEAMDVALSDQRGIDGEAQARLKDEIDGLSAEINSQKTALSSLQNEVDSGHSEAISLRQRLEQGIEREAGLISQVESLSDENQKFQQGQEQILEMAKVEAERAQARSDELTEQLGSLEKELERALAQLLEKEGTTQEREGQFIDLKVSLDQEREETQRLQADLSEAVASRESALRAASDSHAQGQAAMTALQTEYAQAQAEAQEWKSALEDAMARLGQREESIETALEAERSKFKGERQELEQLRREASGLRESRDRLQRELSQLNLRLSDEKDRVRSATKAGVVWSARREAPKEEGIMRKFKSPFKKG